MERKIKTILVDDEPLCTAGLEIDLVATCPELEIVDKINDPLLSIQRIKSLKPDLVFLDIEMPGMNGFEVLEKIENVDFMVIFATAYDEFAVQAFRSNAIDYIMKPIDRTELREAVDKVIQSREDSGQVAKIEKLLQAIHFGPNSKKLSVPNSDGYDLIPIDDIYYCQSHGNYTEIHFDKGSQLVSRVLKQIEASLKGHKIQRVHASFLVNLNKVKSIHRNDGGYIILENDKRIDISRSRKNDVFDKLK